MPSLGEIYITEVCSASSGADSKLLADSVYRNTIDSLACCAMRLAQSTRDNSLDVILEVQWIDRLIRLTRKEKQAVYDCLLGNIRHYRKKSIMAGKTLIMPDWHLIGHAR